MPASGKSGSDPRTYIAWTCNRCGLGLICEDEPGSCGCSTGPGQWDYERLELVEASALRRALELIDSDSFDRVELEPLREALRNLARIESV